MSDARRRRKSHSGDSDDSDSFEEDLNNTKETQSSEQTDGHQDSECDGYASDSDVESQEGALRESGDGQEEEKPQKKLDDDEDRRNPQYIPKKGTFYEHDDRTTDEVPDNTKEPSTERETKEKKVWKDKEDRWDHDRYNDEEQAPKSHEELIAVYGYDIRNEEGPPRARRRRKYGRGPNKYTRNWEDGDAYGKTGGNVAPTKTNNRKFSRSGEDFPALGTNKNTTAQVEEPVISSAWYSSKNKSQIKGHNFPPLQAQQDGPKAKPASTFNTQVNENKAPNEPTNPAWKKDIKHGSTNHSANGNTGAGGDAEKLVPTKASPRDNNKKNSQESVSLAASRARGRGYKANANNNIVANRTVESKPKGRGAGPIAAENRRNNVTQHEDEHQLVHDMKHMNVNDGMQYHQSGRHNKNFYQQSPAQQRPNTVPPRMQQQPHQQQQQTHQQQQTIQQQPQPQQQPQQPDAAGNRPKRYSSLRQRPTIPETPAQQNYPPQHAGQHGYFPPQAGNSRAVLDSQGFPQGHFEQSPPVAAPAAPMAGQPVISLPPSGQPASYAPPAFLVPPPQFIPPQTAPPSIINYVPGPNGPTFPPNFPGYQGYNPPVQPQGPPPPQELFQPQGCTYYSPAQQQQQQQQSAPLRRPKAAIPILPPPDNQQYHQTGRGRGRSTQQNHQNSQPGDTQQVENENKSNIVDVEPKVESGHCESRSEEQIEHVEELEKEEEPCVMVDTVENEEKISTTVTDDTITDITATSTAAITTVSTVPAIPTATTENTVLESPVDEQQVIEMSSEMILDESKTVPLEPIEMTISKTDNESNKSENVISEKSIVEEAAA